MNFRKSFATLVMTATYSTASFAADMLQGNFSLGYGDDRLHLEIAGVNDLRLSLFGGVAVNMDSPLEGDLGEEHWPWMYPGAYKTASGEFEAANLYVGVNYTLPMGRLQQVFGIAADFGFTQKYDNWQEPNNIVGDGGKYHYTYDEGVNVGALVKYDLIINHAFSIGAGYRTNTSSLYFTGGFSF